MSSRKISVLIRNLDWATYECSIEKAYVCSFFSQLAYEYVPAFEINQTGKIKIIPSYRYIEKLKDSTTSDIRETLAMMDLGEPFIIETEFVIIVGIRTPRVTFVAIRGTRKTNIGDWLTNLNIGKAKFCGCGQLKFHKGFHNAIKECFDELYARLNNNSGPIYVTGHSLGGAMAAIMHAYWNNFNFNHISLYYPRTHSCYTFGMPRYGNSAVVRFLETPFHFYNHLDIVPTVPSCRMGFANCIEEYKLTESTIEYTPVRDLLKLPTWLSRLIIGKGIPSHAIELYNLRLSRLVP